ncbi:toll/interleukin-1 receptor domain-containing protein [Craterilacuibacter sp. RT1T]|uniref:toll/interleukin-1 receptor domain-containing protein n=1 Tax=Craterilacuibacter sp. RT1T TaxID=2942211 RepID=UPI0020BDEE87|nr:toll/interleukin-1 receptor domain-containing protein [Craterilacuibacter sp. RT1T]MCL6263735.1 toll/interleukin-1 receptor domain-containing protein [Craterilacuibacter sp. RT1T]
MKVFLSWSGQRSKEVANLLSDWLCCVIQASRPWISTRDLDRGSLWFGEINDQLKDTTVGIICLTQENKTRPWILFEAGALAKGLTTSRVCTLLVDLEPKDIEDPLAQFNHTFPTRESVLGLVKTLNSTLSANGLDSRILEQVFDTYWPQFEKRFAEILSSTDAQPPSKPRPKEDVLGEILENTRILNSRIRKLEHETERSRMRELDMPTSMLHKQAIEMAKAGMPIDMLVDRFSSRLPKVVLKDLANMAERENWATET